MHALVVSFQVFALVFAGALAGMAIRRAVPENHFVPEAKDTVRLAIGLIVTMTVLVRRMLVSSAKTFYDGEKNQVAEMSSQIVLLNDLLSIYGPETKPTRTEARQFLEDAVDRIWPREKTQSFELKPANTGQKFCKQLELLEPKNGAQASTKAQLISLTLASKKTYWLMYLQSEQTSISIPLLVVVTSWLTAIFVSFGIFAPRYATVIITLVICALAVYCGICRNAAFAMSQLAELSSPR